MSVDERFLRGKDGTVRKQYHLLPFDWVDGRAWGSGSLKCDLADRRFPPRGLAFVWDQGIIPPYLTADSAFPQSASILKRYPKSQAVDDVFKSVYNRCHSRYLPMCCTITWVIRCSARARSEMFWYLC